MKASIQTSLFFVLAILAACNSGEVDKASKLAELIAQRDEITTKIEQLQAEIKEENPSQAVIKTKEVMVQEIQPQQFDSYVQTQGLVEAENNILISARSMGVITNVFVEEGTNVSKGQTLAQIDNSLIVSGISEVKSSLELATTVFERQQKLWDQKIGTEIQYLQAKNTKESLEKRLESLNEQLDMTKIKSPIAGSVDMVAVKIGQNIAPGMPTFRVVNGSQLKIKANISEAYSTLIQKGNTVKVEMYETDKTLESKVTFVGQNIDPLSRTFPIEISLASSEDFRPNMTVVLKVVFQSEPSALCVPVNVVQEINGQKVIYVAEREGENYIARKRVVQVGGIYGSLAQIMTNLKQGEKVITVGYQGVNDGEYVKI